jgi:hypothetical protein
MGSRKLWRIALAAPLVVPPGLAFAAGPDQPPNPCYEIIVPQRQTPPDSPLLFNKCTGETWLLVRTGKWNARTRGYRWVSLEADNPARINPDARVAPSAPAAKPPAPGEKCFEMAGRRYCE